MNLAVFLLLFSALLSAYELKREYFYTHQTIYSTDLIPEVSKKFEILKIPDDKTLFRIDSRVIAKTYELHGISIDISKTPVIQFSKETTIDFSPFVDQLSHILHQRYRSIDISRITITPRGYLASIPADTKANFDDRCYLNSKGTFFILDSSGLRRYLDYSVDANISLLHTTDKVRRKEQLSAMNTSLKTVPFTSYKDMPLSQIPKEGYRYRSNLQSGYLLTHRNLEEIPLVLKNEKVIVTVQNGLVVVEFGAVAMQEGSLYDIITVQKRDGKRAKAKVIGENRVELQ